MAEKVDRLTRVNALLQRELGSIFESELLVPVGMLISVVEVRSSVDLRNATVDVSIFGGTPESRAELFKQLLSRRSSMQSKIARTIAFKNTPVLNFKLDDRTEKGDRIFEMLNSPEENTREDS